MKKIFHKIDSMKLNKKFTSLVILVVLFPIGILAGVIYYNMEQNVINENINYMQYTMERNESRVAMNVDAIRMATQLVLSDDAVLDILNNAYTGKKNSIEELMAFKEKDVANIERLVNNSPLLYCVRVYSVTDSIQETMPVLYNKSRMDRMSWSHSDNLAGWHYGYNDNIFSSLLTSTNVTLMSLITPIDDFQNGRVGIIETAMEARMMFPALVENQENEWSCVVTNEGNIIYGKDAPENAEELINQIIGPYVDMDSKSIGEFFDNEENRSKHLILSSLNNEKLFIGTDYFKLNGRKYTISYMKDKKIDGALISFRDITKSVNEIYQSRNFFIILAIFILILLTILVNWIVNRLLGSFYEIMDGIREVQEGNLNVRIKNIRENEMGELGSQLNTMLEKIQILMEDNISREVLVKNSEIRALQNQINAHFIYNVLETIKMMAEIDEEYAISDAITALGKLLRYSMKWVSGNVIVADELDYIRNYVALINLRFDYEIILSVKMPREVLNQEIPKMSLQPIVENAILHGIEEVAEDTTIYIKGYIKDDDCIIEITDSGKGMNAVQVESLKQKIAGKIETEGGSGNGIGLKNVQDRITIAFGPEYGLDIVSKIDCFTKVIVHLPHIENQRVLPDKLK